MSASPTLPPLADNPRQMRIVLISPVGFVGGAERVLLTAVRSLARLGHEAHVIALTDGQLIDRALEAGAASAAALPMPAALAATGDSAAGPLHMLARGLSLLPRAFNYTRDLRRAVDALAPDLIHSNGLKTHMLLWAAKPRAPVVWHLHDFIARRRTASRALCSMSPRARRAIAISRAVAIDARQVLPRTPIDVVMNAIDTDRFSPESAASPGKSEVSQDSALTTQHSPPHPGNLLDSLANLPPLGHNVLRIGLVATYARWKGQDLFLRAAARAAHANPALSLRFFIVGGPIYHTAGSQWSVDELRRLAEDLGIARRVGFVPFQSDPLVAYRGLDVVVHASTQPEPFGLTIVEAMSCQKPVIVSGAGGAVEIIEDGISALSFPPNDSNALADRIARLATDPTLRQAIAAQARRRAVESFTESHFGPKLVAAYTRALSR